MDINDKIAANLGLVYSLLAKFQLADDQDAESYAYEALYKAICTYDEKIGTTFSTYATCVISNALRNHLRHKSNKRQLHVISYDEPLNDSDNELFILDTIAHEETAEACLMYKELKSVIKAAYKRVIDGFTSDVQRKIALLWLSSSGKISQKEIAAKANVSQALVSRTLSSFKYKLSLELEEYL